MPLLGNEKNALEVLRNELSKNYKIFDFRLYGSKVKGTDLPGSDLDVMIILDRSTPDVESAIDDLIFEINLEHNCLISALYFDRDEIESGPMSESPIYKKILQEGVKL